MTLDWKSAELAEGLRCYRAEEFFLAHEHWEAVWLRCQDPEKTFLQALIQIAAAFHHLQKQNRAGTASLLKASLRRLQEFPARFAGIDVALLREELRAWLQSLELADPLSALPFPRLR
jgi:uncharacterized protein